MNAGFIQGGLSGDGITRANAIEFTGGTNRLTLLAGSNISGNVLASSNLDTLELGGDADASLDTNPYKGFGRYVKTGASTWTLTASNPALTPWTVNAGTLSIASDGALGDVAGGLALDGGALRTTADIQTARVVTLGVGGGTLQPDEGTTLTLTSPFLVASEAEEPVELAKRGEGTLRLTADNSGFTGNTLVAAGRLQVEGPLTTRLFTVADTGSATVDIVGAGVLQSELAIVGRDGGSVGQVRVSGNGATWNTWEAYVGSAGTGGLTIEQGANVSGGLLVLGETFTGHGSLFVRGENSRLNISEGSLVVGGDGTGVAEIRNGGQADVGDMGIGLGDQAMGRLTVEGRGSAVRVNTNLTVSHGVASVSGGAQLAVEDSTFIDRAGTIEVSGASTRFESARTGVLGGRLSVSDGAQANSSILVSGNGLASVSGTGSRLDAQDLDIGDGEEGGSMVVSGGASLVSTGITRIGRLYSVGALTLTGAGTRWDHSGSETRTAIGNGGVGRLTIEDGAVAEGASAMIGSDAGADGGVLVSGKNSRWTLSGTLEIAPGSNGEAIGALTVREGAKVEVPSIVLSRDLGTAALNIGAAPGEAAAGAGQVVANSVVLGSANASLNFNHLDADHAFAPAIEGAGTIRVLSGGTHFTGNSASFQGPLQISGGTAFVDRVLGDGSVAATVTGGGSLGGSGTLGGNVEVSEGGRLLGRSGQTLTMGQLVLGNASNLDVALGAFSPQALFQVNGDLTLGGKLNVSDSGGFGAGIYRLINYTGTLTDNGLAIGSAPIDASQLEIQTAVAHQVNLVNHSGPVLSFWDGGDSAAYGNGTVNGGAGRWNAGTAAWTGADGQVNGVWNPRAFAVFQGQPGTVTIDAGEGPLAFSGAQFAVDGYRLEGGALGIDKPDTLIRVGDGSAAGAAMRATIAAPITGSGGLVKNDLGTLVLAGANSYAGPTTVSAGTLRADGPGALSSGSAFTVASDATLDLAGHSQAIASVANSGTVNLAGSAPGTTLTVRGPWIGNGGTLRLSTALGDSRSPSDRLVLDGPAATASGRTQIQVTNHGGLGAMTTGNGIEVVTAMNGATTTAQTSKDAFSLAGGHVDAGAYEYRLFAADADGKGENWYLRSSTSAPAPTPPGAPTPVGAPAPVPTYRTEVPLLAALPAQLRQADVAMLASSHRRSGDDDASAPVVASLEPVAGALTSDRRAWARTIHDDLDLRQPGTVAPASKGRVTGLQAGSDLFASGDGRWRSGVYVGSQDGRADVSGLASGLWRRVGTNDLRARYLGAYAGFENATGFYADAVLQYGAHSYTARPLAGLPVGGKGKSLVASLELGQAFRLAGSWTLEPQLQLMHRHARLDDAALPLALVRQDDGSGWQARAGVRIKGDLATAAGRLQPYARVDVHRGSGSSTAQFIGPGGTTGITSGMGHTSVGLAGGATLALGRSASLYGEIGKLFSTGGGAQVASSVQGAIGLRVRW